MYFDNILLLENTLLPYFCEAEPLKYINKKFYQLNYEKYNTHLQPHGIVEAYYPDTQTIKDRKIYRNAVLHGLYEEFGKNGMLWAKITFQNGKENGLAKEFHENGKLWERCNYIDGKLDGLCEQWYKNGQLQHRRNYINGKLNDLSEKWDEDGEKITYKNGVGWEIRAFTIWIILIFTLNKFIDF
jgi:antitoxin component YwqK of YwqJK toxin-antitoxin module